MASTIDIGPIDLGSISVYSGDPLDISFANDGESYEGKSFVGHVREHRRASDILASFVITTAVITGEEEITDGTLEITLKLSGDSEVGVEDGETRLLPRTSVFDVQMQDENGALEETLATGRLVVTQDVTR